MNDMSSSGTSGGGGGGVGGSNRHTIAGDGVGGGNSRLIKQSSTDISCSSTKSPADSQLSAEMVSDVWSTLTLITEYTL